VCRAALSRVMKIVYFSAQITCCNLFSDMWTAFKFTAQDKKIILVAVIGNCSTASLWKLHFKSWFALHSYNTNCVEAVAHILTPVAAIGKWARLCTLQLHTLICAPQHIFSSLMLFNTSRGNPRMIYLLSAHSWSHKYLLLLITAYQTQLLPIFC